MVDHSELKGKEWMLYMILFEYDYILKLPSEHTIVWYLFNYNYLSF